MSEPRPPSIHVEPPTTGLALASLILGILSFVCLGPIGPIPAVLCGHMALSRIRNSRGQEGGEGMALTGLILGYIALVLFLIGLPLVYIQVNKIFKSARTTTEEALSNNNARQLTLLVINHADDNEGRLPENLEDLIVSPDTIRRLQLNSPFDDDQGTVDYELLISGNISRYTNPAQTRLLREIPLSPSGTRAVGYLDGHVAREPGEDDPPP